MVHKMMPTCSEVLTVLETALTYMKQPSEVSAMDVLMFRRWQDLTVRKCHSAGKQPLMTSFFLHVQ